MKRRSLLQVAGTLGAGVLAGCVGEGGEEEFNLQVAAKDFGENADGNLAFNVTVSNPGNTRQTGTLEISAELNDRDLVRLREVTLDAHETTEVSIEFDIRYDNVTSFSPEASVRPKEPE